MLVDGDTTWESVRGRALQRGAYDLNKHRYYQLEIVTIGSKTF